MEDTTKTLELLNDLVLINNDRIEGYERALKEIKENETDSDLEPVFLRLIDNSRRYKMQIGTEIQALGRDIEQGTTASGKLHRAWTAVKEAFNGHDRYSILDECEASEDATRNAYQDALTDDTLPAYIIDMLDEQMQEILDAHEQIKSLRDSVH
ncbi:MAG TPA: PA2169 family four-helix-bundle protein [Mucilaginibacter sp.]|nr:PA2169 family four-helix-bundle protein [Mucilaginibacter sp.]HVW16246.1 PA2169 family four-helix-bundle protein [Mucilaginibacter sp.]